MDEREPSLYPAVDRFRDGDGGAPGGAMDPGPGAAEPRSPPDVASRLAVIDTLIAGVAHEVNNPLAVQMASQVYAIGVVEKVLRHLRSGAPVDGEEEARRLEEVADALGDALASGRRIARVVKDLSVFQRPDPRHARVRLVDVAEEAVRWLPRKATSQVSVRVEDGGAPDVIASAEQMGQVISHLVANGVQSIPERRPGTVVIAVGPGAAGMARIEVIDDGVGMDGATLERIFDPFFSTREVGEGTGLGLPVCHAIVAAHGGHILVGSSPGKGTSIRVELPAAQ